MQNLCNFPVATAIQHIPAICIIGESSSRSLYFNLCPIRVLLPKAEISQVWKLPFAWCRAAWPTLSDMGEPIRTSTGFFMQPINHTKHGSLCGPERYGNLRNESTKPPAWAAAWLKRAIAREQRECIAFQCTVLFRRTGPVISSLLKPWRFLNQCLTASYQ